MKTKITLIIAAITIMMGISSCKKATFLKVENDSIQTTITGSKGFIKIETDGGKVEVTHVPDWIKANVNETLDTLFYEISLNTDRQIREDSIVLKSSDLSCKILVKQSFKATYIKFSPEEVTISSKGGSEEVTVDVDGEGELSIDHQDIAHVDGRKIIVTLPKNDEPNDKSYIINVSCDDISAILKVVQKNSKCTACNGTGYSNRICPICNGAGFHACCNYVGKEYCSVCNGSGITD